MMVRPTAAIPFTPWFRARMTAEDRNRVTALRFLYGVRVRGYAMSASGPFTATVYQDGLTRAGVGSSPSEALGRLDAKLRGEL